MVNRWRHNCLRSIFRRICILTHPLTGDLSIFSDKELYDKLQALKSKYWLVSNTSVKNQIEMLLADYYIEIENRKAKENKEVDNLIKVV